MKHDERQVKRDQAGKHASGPAGRREAGCGTVVLYGAAGERLQTIRYGRMPERRKATLQQQLETETARILAVQADLKRVLLTDGAEPNWSLLTEYVRQGLPIASGVIEASCKTLATQRLKQSGMAWTQAGGQAILTLRSPSQSDRWQPAWELLRSDFRKTVAVGHTSTTSPARALQEHAHRLHPFRDQLSFSALPLAE